MLDRPGGFICLCLSLTTLNSEEFTLSSVRFLGGLSAFGFYMFIYALVFPYISLLVDCFEWATIGKIEQRTVHSVLWKFQLGGSICLWYLYVLYMHWYFLIFPDKLSILNQALIGNIEQRTVHSVLWQ